MNDKLYTVVSVVILVLWYPTIFGAIALASYVFGPWFNFLVIFCIPIMIWVIIETEKRKRRHESAPPEEKHKYWYL